MPSVESRNILLGTVSKHCAWHSTAQCCNCKGLEEEKGKLVCSSLQGYDGRLRLSRSGRPERESQAQAGKGTAPTADRSPVRRSSQIRARTRASQSVQFPEAPRQTTRLPARAPGSSTTDDDDLSIDRPLAASPAAALATLSVFAWLISHPSAVLFSHNKLATSNQPTVFFSQNQPAPAISHQPNEQAVYGCVCGGDLRARLSHGCNFSCLPHWPNLKA
jgi:hypothetical protein